MPLGGAINDKKKTGRPISWTPARKNHLKRLTNNHMQGNDNYYTNDKLKWPDSVRFAEKEKYPDKLMVW